MDTIVDINQKITIKQESKTKTIKQFSTRLPVRFRKCHETAAKINQHDMTLISDEYINANLLEEDELNINIYENNPYVITITDKKSGIKDEFYKFTFLKLFS